MCHFDSGSSKNGTFLIGVGIFKAVAKADILEIHAISGFLLNFLHTFEHKFRFIDFSCRVWNISQI